MVQMEIIRRVIRINFSNSLGTCFTIESHGEQFLVTAKHLFENAGYPDFASIQLLLGASYQTFEVYIRYPAEQQVDIAVMKFKNAQFLTPVYPNVNSTEGLVLGQDVFFVGFPYEYDRILGMCPNGNTLIPLVKKACMSAMLQDGKGTLLLDGINNPGFSGSPVCFKRIGSQSITMSIFGVVSSYRFFILSLFDRAGKQTNYFVKENTGIIIVSDIKHAIQIADSWI